MLCRVSHYSESLTAFPLLFSPSLAAALAVSRRCSRRLSPLLSPSLAAALAVSRRCSRRLLSLLSPPLVTVIPFPFPFPLGLKVRCFFFYPNLLALETALLISGARSLEVDWLVSITLNT